MLKISVDLSKARTLLELARQEGGERLHSLTGWMRSFVQQGIEALLRAELAVVLEWDAEPNSRNGASLYVAVKRRQE